MNIERARLIQMLAKEEVANIALGRAEYDAVGVSTWGRCVAHKWQLDEEDWTRRCSDAALDDFEHAEFQRIRAMYARLMGR